MCAISVSEVTVKKKSVEILREVSLQVPKQSIYGLIGPSGSGKTTLIRAIVGLQRIDSGNIKVLDQPAGSKTLRRKLGYMTQGASCYEDLTVLENVKYFSSILGSGVYDVGRVLKVVELEGIENRLVSKCSGGEKARVALACSLLGNPKVLIMDEPTVGLDPLLRMELWSFFKKLASEGVTILLSSHVMDEAEKCDQLSFMRDGHILISGDVEIILKSTATEHLESAFLKLSMGSR